MVCETNGNGSLLELRCFFLSRFVRPYVHTIRLSGKVFVKCHDVVIAFSWFTGSHEVVKFVYCKLGMGKKTP